jgi:hypothetical protein
MSLYLIRDKMEKQAQLADIINILQVLFMLHNDQQMHT